MAVLSDADRARIWRALMRFLSAQGEEVNCNKDLLRTLVNQADDWLDDSRTSFLAALSPNDLSGSIIAWILACTVLMRKGDAATYLARLLGVEVD